MLALRGDDADGVAGEAQLEIVTVRPESRAGPVGVATATTTSTC